ncbi:hypothetical protein [Paraburkholderia sp. 40]|uniref:hypothetical protein n=1 Tax=Paraburkholderia sp. 40 TaxID=2991059 RepID=UPI003D1E96C8
MMNPRSIRIAGHMVLTSLTLYVADVLLRTNNSVAGAMLLILGTLVIHLLRPLIHSSIEPPSMSFRVWLNKSSLRKLIATLAAARQPDHERARRPLT